jgi:hypothetical protein
VRKGRLRNLGQALLFSSAFVVGCAASGSNVSSSSGGATGSGGSGGSGTPGDASAGSAGTAGAGGGINVKDASTEINPDAACATSKFEGQHAPAAMLIVLDRSSSMVTNGKWAAAQQAIVQAVDIDDFDHMTLGLLAFPAFREAGPACLLHLQVSCGVSSLPQVPLADDGTDKTNASSGVRHDIYSWLTANSPDTTATDASPGYDAMNAGIAALQGYAISGKRLMLFITDGGFSCTSMSSPLRPNYSDGECPDWENPNNVVTLLTNAYNDPNKPVSTFIVGVPGSDSTGQNQGAYATPPYHMRLALSAYALAGSPTTVPAGCNGTFTKTGGDPAIPCHFDMTTGTFSPQALADVINTIRGKALGCVYEVPTSEAGAVDPTKINVDISTNGSSYQQIQKRANQSDTCTNDGCWDYNSQGQIELLGKACSDVQTATDGKVQILVGCPTHVK